MPNWDRRAPSPPRCSSGRPHERCRSCRAHSRITCWGRALRRRLLLDAVRRQGALGPQARLAIYHNAYRARMREALCEAYERTWTYIGDALFETLAAAYLDAHPSSSSNLRWFGGGFPAFLAQELADYPWVAELAGFEWTLGLAFDAPDAPQARARCAARTGARGVGRPALRASSLGAPAAHVPQQRGAVAGAWRRTRPARAKPRWPTRAPGWSGAMRCSRTFARSTPSRRTHCRRWRAAPPSARSAPGCEAG
ncbi:DNA-binding domain-containing protein [Massilia sp. B-10]|nr:DNA-binding domain-containing protein [Massilia sp. B-10]